MNPRTRAARATIRTRSTQTRAAARIRRNGAATLTTHGVAAGLTHSEARSVAGSLRKAAARLGIQGVEGVAFRKGNRHACARYTPQQVAVMALRYRPRKPAFKTAAARLALAA
jgi:hypothetical protein